MATRVIEDRRDRLITILVAPLMSCSARLPVYSLLIAAFIPNYRFLGGWLGLQGATIMALYLLGIVVAVAVAKLFRRTFLRGETPPFVMELPDFRFPSPRNVFARVVEQCWAFLHDAGTLILAVTVIVWAAGYFPRPAQVEQEIRARFAGQVAELTERLASLPETDAPDRDPESERAELQDRLADLEDRISNHVAGAYMEQSILGRLGKLIAPVVRPLGWDWRIGCAVIASFPAREVVIGAMGVIYNMGEGHDEESPSLRQTLAAQKWPETGQPIFTIPVALSILVFFALCAQCAATLVVIRKETGSRWWPLFTFTYMTLLAYLGAWLTYHGGTWLGL
jgi:ferrous iron transport protein B